MSIQFILGRAGSGKTCLCINEAAGALRQTDGPPLVLLVPEQATYQVERAIVSMDDIAGFSRLRILSFDRLRFWLLPKAAGAGELSPLGRRIILQRILNQSADRLRIFGSCASQPGLAGRIAQELTEFYQADLSPDQIRQAAKLLTKQQAGAQTRLKMEDLADLFEQYQQYLTDRQDRILDADSFLSQARGRIRQADFLQNALLWVDGFSGFTLQEMALLRELAQTAGQTKIALCLDAADFDPAVRNEDQLDPYSVFSLTEQTYVQLANLFAKTKQKIESPILLKKAHRFSNALPLGHLEKAFFTSDKVKPVDAGNAIHVAALPDVRGECLWISRKIQQLVREENLRYRQIAVVVPDLSTYEHPLYWAFERMGIPFFLDRPRPLRTHPVADLILCALGAVCGGYTAEDITAYLKTDLTGAEKTQIDLLDNYCRACGVEGSDWTQNQPWNFADKANQSWNESEIDSLRRKIIEPLEQFRKELKIPNPIGPAQFTAALWAFLDRLQIRQTLTQWAADDPSDQQYGHRQFWDKLIGLLDEICRVDEDSTHSATEFAEFLLAGFSELTVKRIPPALDQVLVGAIERSRHPDIRILFLLGATAKLFPVPVRTDSLLSTEDRRLLEAMDFAQTASIETQLLQRNYLTYIALSRANRKIFLTRHTTDDNGSPIQPWPGLEVLGNLFADLKTEFPSGEPEIIEQVQSANELKYLLTCQLGRDPTADENERATAAAVLDAWDGNAAFVRDALNWQNRAELDDAIAKQCFPDPPAFSISRLETFAACPYKFFASYMLRLQKRRLAKLEPIDFGSFYHNVLDELFKKMKTDGHDWRRISDKQLTNLTHQIIEQVCLKDTAIQGYQRHSAHQGFVIIDLCSRIPDFVLSLRQMIKAGTFTPADTEMTFGMKGQPPLILKDSAGKQVLLHGVIDRIDMAQTDDGTAAVIFDYKRTARSFSWTKWFYGLGLQLPVYLLAAQDIQKTKAIGAFFIPIVTSAGSKDLTALKKETESFRHKAKGLLNGDSIKLLDENSSGWSDYYSVYINKEGSPYSNFKHSSAVYPEQFEKILEQTKSIVLELTDQIRSGQITAAPYRLGNQSPCSFCEYRPVCKFDWQINEYRPLESMDKQQVLARLEDSDG